jgi:hypothetical protein
LAGICCKDATVIPRTILVVAEPFGEELDAQRVAQAIGRGLQSGDASLGLDSCTLPAPIASRERAAPAELPAGFDARMHSARAVVIAARELDRYTLLQRGAVFETATRARQGGVPCYAVAAHSGLDAFQARILDLQVVLQAGDKRALRAAGRRLAGIV